MKNSCFFLGIALIIASSCNTGKEGCYTGKVNYPEQSKFEVASSALQINFNKAMPSSGELPVHESKPIDSRSLLSEESPQTDESSGADEPLLLVMAPVENERNEMTVEELKTRMAEELRMVAGSSESRFAGWILNRTAKKIETKDFQAKENLTFFDKLKAKIFGKLQAKYARGGGMSTADILAIVSLVAGVVAFAAFHGSFLLGLAAIITGAIALKKGTSRRGMAIAGIVFGAVAILFWSGWLFIF